MFTLVKLSEEQRLRSQYYVMGFCSCNAKTIKAIYVRTCRHICQAYRSQTLTKVKHSRISFSMVGLCVL